MKELILIFSFIIMCVGCSESITPGGGTLGVSASRNIDCSVTDVEQVLDQLIDSSEFTIPKSDSMVVAWWHDGGFDFLNYKCLKIEGHYFMITLLSEGVETTSMSIRSMYTPKLKQWKHALKFSKKDEAVANSALTYLFNKIPPCGDKVTF